MERTAVIMKMTLELAWDAACDAGNGTMRRGGRTSWSAYDYDVAFTVFDTLWQRYKGEWSD